MIDLHSRLKEIICQSPKIMRVLETCREVALPDWRLVSGAVYGTIFNSLTNRAPEYGIKDYDICYFDPDLSWDAEDIWIKRIDAALPEDLRSAAEVRNQARVHLWFEAKFGRPYAQLNCTDESLDSYLCFAHAVAIRLEMNDNISIWAPFGLEDVFEMKLRPNPNNKAPDRFMEKSLSIQSRWPEVKIIV